jgi:hypothetical protein
MSSRIPLEIFLKFEMFVEDQLAGDRKDLLQEGEWKF